MVDVLRLTDNFIVDTLGLRNSLKDAAEKNDRAATSVLADALVRAARQYATIVELRDNDTMLNHWRKLLEFDPNLDCDTEELAEIVATGWMISSKDFKIVSLGEDGEWRK